MKADARKPAARASTIRQSTPLPLRAIRGRIWEQATDLVASGEGDNLLAILARRFELSPRSIALCLVLEGMRFERTATSLRTGLLSTLAMGRDAAAVIDREIADVA